MKTRIIKTKFWSDSKVLRLSSDGRLVLLCLLTSPQAGMTNYIEIGDSFLLLYTGLDRQSIESAKKELESISLAFFRDGWVYVPNLEKHNLYKNSPMNQKAYLKERKSIPKKLLEEFEGDTSIDSTIDSSMHSNHKLEIINNKLETINQKTKDSGLELLRKNLRGRGII